MSSLAHTRLSPGGHTAKKSWTLALTRRLTRLAKAESVINVSAFWVAGIQNLLDPFLDEIDGCRNGVG